ncbi:MgtC/SapB family protein [Burkholderia glumae]|uniref:Protein MgtC n=3 Tax=Burkholderia glumae TaxID=337 RepID=A0AAP9XXH4_BURGL|nr:MgtC/SapB family protein [Burkholderia glumae]ACR30531.1 MgtC/SapB transporter [Burkholderia glumae BGR1]AJY63394.1 mgtC family protein [Burkholderia glumae LMG 2196 = ATCC 33617]KHJ60090.1 magnesium transporter MgtC [Burkholderia glumae]MCM2484180.1 MgtC/SapB family protein [Burkholderia glumae]MCM2509870.1 MgtC/SapB family protein [Burkholderia glumae]
MLPMPLTLDYAELALRLATCLVASAIIGFDRRGSGKAAGLRTTMLVGLAACLAMLQVNALLPQAGKAPQSFATLDLMRLPLGILSGVGFIGAGAILRKEGWVRGLTTAATLWFVTVVGLCAGGGQLLLAAVATGLGVAILSGLKPVERRLPRRRRARLRVIQRADGAPAPGLAETLARLDALHCRVSLTGMQALPESGTIGRVYELKWQAARRDDPVEQAIAALVSHGGGGVSWSLRE